jgi:hypothetical protein
LIIIIFIEGLIREGAYRLKRNKTTSDIVLTHTHMHSLIKAWTWPRLEIGTPRDLLDHASVKRIC